ncbi:MAG: hypothetical protein JNM07_05585 [Phycisphaerae bacterium]|nr:hypothetical protein [Phycisphaerae bacterium]
MADEPSTYNVSEEKPQTEPAAPAGDRAPSAPAITPAPAAGFPEVAPEFVLPGRGSPAVVFWLGAILLVGACTAAGINYPARQFVPVAGRVVFTTYDVLLHTVTGVVAVGIAAWLQEQRFGRVDLAVARVFMAYSAFALIANVNVPIPYVGTLVGFALAALAYWALILVLFDKDKLVGTMIAGVHFVIWASVALGTQLGVWVQASAQAVGAK